MSPQPLHIPSDSVLHQTDRLPRSSRIGFSSTFRMNLDSNIQSCPRIFRLNIPVGASNLLGQLILGPCVEYCGMFSLVLIQHHLLGLYNLRLGSLDPRVPLDSGFVPLFQFPLVVGFCLCLGRLTAVSSICANQKQKQKDDSLSQKKKKSVRHAPG